MIIIQKNRKYNNNDKDNMYYIKNKIKKITVVKDEHINIIVIVIKNKKISDIYYS